MEFFDQEEIINQDENIRPTVQFCVATADWEYYSEQENESEKEPNINFIPTPENIRDKYQYFTEAKMEKLRNQGYSERFYSLEEGVKDYVQKYLIGNKVL